VRRPPWRDDPARIAFATLGSWFDEGWVSAVLPPAGTLDERAVAAHREDAGFVVETDRGQRLRAGAVILSTGVMDRQPSVKLTTIDRRERAARRARVLEGR
jgi:hypothetical protein